MAAGKDIKAGEAYVIATVRDKTAAGLAAVQARLRSWGKGLTVAGGALMAVGGGLLAGLGLAAKAAADYASSIKDASDRTGVAIEDLQALRFAAMQNGASFEDLEHAIKFMQKGGFGENIDDMKRLADEIAGMSSPAEQTARSIEVFGRGGTKLLPMLKGGSAAIHEMMEKARRLGLVISQNDVEAAEEFGDKIAVLQQQTQMLEVAIGSALIPTLTELIEPLMEIGGQIVEFIRNNKALVLIVATVGAAFLAAGTALVAFGFIAIGVGAAIGALGAILGAIFSPIGLVIAAVAGIGIGVAALTVNFRAMGERWGETWQGIVAMVQKGELQAAFKIVATALKLEWANVILYWTKEWRKFKNTMFTEPPGKNTFSEIGAQFVGALAWPFGLRKAVLEDYERDRKSGNLLPPPTPLEQDPGVIAAQKLVDELTKELKGLIDAAKLPVPEKPPLAAKASVPMGLADVARGLYGTTAIQASLAQSDKIQDRIAKATEEAAVVLNRIEDKMGLGMEFA